MKIFPGESKCACRVEADIWSMVKNNELPLSSIKINDIWTFHLLSLSRLECPKAVFLAQSYSWCSSMISLTLWKIIYISCIYLLMTPFSAMTSLILQTGRLQPLPCLQTLKKKKSQSGQTLGICLSILTNLKLSLSLSERSIWQMLQSIFWTILLRKFSHSNSWVSLSAMIFLGQTRFQRLPEK